MRRNKCPLVLVEWVDSSSTDGWQPWNEIDNDKKELICYSVGWLKHSNKTNCVLVPHIVERKGHKQGCGVMTIPTCSINSITILE